MNAWLLSALLCTPASAGVVVEVAAPAAPVAPVSGAVGAAVMPVSAVPGASVFAPSLGAAAAFSAFPGQAPAAVYLAPPAAVPAAPSAQAVPVAPASPVPSAQPRRRREMVPPADGSGARSLTVVAPNPASDGPAAGAVGALSARVDAAGEQAAVPVVGPGRASPVPAESAAEDGASVFDNSARRALLDDSDRASGRDGSDAAAVAAGAFAGPTAGAVRGRLRPAADTAADLGPAFLSPGETVHDAVGAPAPAPGGRFARAAADAAYAGRAAVRATAGAPSTLFSGRALPATTPAPFDRLSVESGSGLVVRIGAAAGPASLTVGPKPFAAGTLPPASGAAAAPGRGAPVTSTEWLERRGLLETLSVTEAAAEQTARAAASAGPSYAPLVARREPPPARRDSPSPLPEPLWWGLAFLPAAAVLLKDALG